MLPIQALGRLRVEQARRLTGLIGPLLMRLISRRRAVVDQNLRWCFPEKTESERLILRRSHFQQLAEAIGEIAVAWCKPDAIGPDQGYVEGLEYLEAAQQTGRGILLLTGHTTCLEWSARIFGQTCPSSGIYRPLSNPILERFQNQGRARYAQHMFDRDDLRGMVRYLRAGGVLWYAPDQDFGLKRSDFAPFFGIETATVRAIPELARLGRAVVVPMYPIKNEKTGQVVVHIEPAWLDYPSGDGVFDATRFNAFLERYVRLAPAQYWWVHQRFKTAPDGTHRYERGFD